jgi:hypothetical protein
VRHKIARHTVIRVVEQDLHFLVGRL